MQLTLGLDALEFDVWHHQLLLSYLVDELPLAHMALIISLIRQPPNLVPKDSSLLTLGMLERTLWVQTWIETTCGFHVRKFTAFLLAIGAKFARRHRGRMAEWA